MLVFQLTEQLWVVWPPSPPEPPPLLLPLEEPLLPELPPEPPLELPELLPDPPLEEPEPLLLVWPGAGAERPTRPFGGPNVVSVSPPHAATAVPATSATPIAKA